MIILALFNVALYFSQSQLGKLDKQKLLYFGVPL